jgi:hypothetical protein
MILIWLGRQDSNLGMAESKSYILFFLTMPSDIPAMFRIPIYWALRYFLFPGASADILLSGSLVVARTRDFQWRLPFAALVS